MDMPSKCDQQSTTQYQKLTLLNPDDFKPQDRGRYLPVLTVVKQLAEPVHFSIQLIVEDCFNGRCVLRDYDWEKFTERKYILDNPISHVYLKVSEKVEQKFKDVLLGYVSHEELNLKESDDFRFFQHDSHLSLEWRASPNYYIPQCGAIDLQIRTLAFYNPYNNMPHHFGFPDNQGSLIKLSGNRERSNFYIHRCGNDTLQEIFNDFLYFSHILYPKNKNGLSENIIEVLNGLLNEIRMVILQLYVCVLLKSSLQYI